MAGRSMPEINSGSMADIAFLLLIFFLVTTTIASDKGVALLLPPKPDEDQKAPELEVNKRNIFTVLVNSQDKILIEDEAIGDISRIKNMAKRFILNMGAPTPENAVIYKALPNSLKEMVERNPESSDNPADAVVSYKTDRGTSYQVYINVLDQLQAAYYEIYSERVGLETESFRVLDRKDKKQGRIYDTGREGIPMNISIAEPTKIGN